MKINCNVTGSFKGFIDKLKKIKYSISDINLNHYGDLGVKMLKETTPKDSTKTAKSWDYTIEQTRYGKILSFTNDNVTAEGTPIAILLEYGHATKSGSWYDGQRYIEPAIDEIVKTIIDEINSKLR